MNPSSTSTPCAPGSPADRTYAQFALPELDPEYNTDGEWIHRSEAAVDYRISEISYTVESATVSRIANSQIKFGEPVLTYSVELRLRPGDIVISGTPEELQGLVDIIADGIAACEHDHAANSAFLTGGAR